MSGKRIARGKHSNLSNYSPREYDGPAMQAYFFGPVDISATVKSKFLALLESSFCDKV